MEEQAVIAERPPLIIPSPVDDTDSDEQAPQSAQDPSVQAEHGGNSDNMKVELFPGPMKPFMMIWYRSLGEMNHYIQHALRS